jgi:hypothetical protein
MAATTIDDFFLPGSQVGQSGNIETPDRCDNCHGGYDQAVEPAFNWRGSMMSQAARDPLFFACLAIANQDAPDVGDLCLRCHTPDGWLNGRCEPTDGSALNNNDRQGVQCDFCHKMVKPTALGINPYPLDGIYTSQTYPQDQSYLGTINPIPGYSGNGMYVADANNAKRGPFTDAVGRHQMFYSPFHSTSDHCGTCHDVSNPQFTRVNINSPYLYNDENTPAPSYELSLLLPVERTYSEWKVSSFNGTGGKSCQDCHMKDVTGKGAKLKDAPVRTNLPLHDMTGGNTFTPNMVKTQSAAEINPAALDAGVIRARNNLQTAATLELTVNSTKTTATVKVTNNTGHKLPSGYPEGRRIWINLKASKADNTLLKEYGVYDQNEAHLYGEDTKVYEIHPGISTEWAQTLASLGKNIPAGPSFHFVLNDMVCSDNRIPPAGATILELIDAQSPIVGYSYADNQNWDITTFALPAGTEKVEARLFYQTTTREYVEFLRDENTTNTRGQELYDLWFAHGKSAPELMEEAVWPLPTLLVPEFVTVSRTTNKQGIAQGYAIVKVTCGGTPIEGANVTSSYTGPTSGSVSGLTSTNGLVTLYTTKIKNPAGVWCFTLTNVSKTGYDSPVTYPTACESQAKTDPSADEALHYINDLQLFPNPAGSGTNITYSLARPSQTSLTIYDYSGRQIATITEGWQDAGMYTVAWNVSGLPKGIYFIRMQINSIQLMKKLLVIK